MFYMTMVIDFYPQKFKNKLCKHPKGLYFGLDVGV